MFIIEEVETTEKHPPQPRTHTDKKEKKSPIILAFRAKIAKVCKLPIESLNYNTIHSWSDSGFIGLRWGLGMLSLNMYNNDI